MSNNYFQFKKFKIIHKESAMKVGTDGVLLGAWTNIFNVKKVLDIGTGTGLIALMVAQRTNSKIDGVEIDKASYDEALFNVENSPWNDKIILYHSSFQNFHHTHSGKYDLIVSNPPFFQNSFKPNSIEKQKAKHTDNLTFEELIDGVTKLLSNNGRFTTILPITESSLFIELALTKNLHCHKIEYIQPKPQKQENRVLIEFQFSKIEVKPKTLIIRNDDNSFTEEYKNLTKDFYLDF